ncbi:uracil-DNA glycosylase [Shewanella submarina]|uniref:Uracil-DNA glycosylase n=1 Tax=Shewanella submarina TaxID=2016376 RepID=A0ABV7GBB1_9GAMM|nr:uracil-DNA glycosylase [Shewanella submarina]MCL1039467.1 uracil-DNA glycosylase [Shewanella submarina]
MTTWTDVLAAEKSQPYFMDTLKYVAARRAEGITVYPPKEEVFSAFAVTPFDKVKVVILGQDPYHGPGQAHGLCFSVKHGIQAPPSLQNIYQELASDIPGFQVPNHGYLQSWAEQGVLLLNTVLTVEGGQAHSHKHLGWEQFTDRVIQQINDHRQGVIFMLWGSHAQKKGQVINSQKHIVLTAPHPSPLSAHRGFFGCRHFSTANQILAERGEPQIHWQL